MKKVFLVVALLFLVAPFSFAQGTTSVSAFKKNAENAVVRAQALAPTAESFSHSGNVIADAAMGDTIFAADAATGKLLKLQAAADGKLSFVSTSGDLSFALQIEEQSGKLYAIDGVGQFTVTNMATGNSTEYLLPSANGFALESNQVLLAQFGQRLPAVSFVKNGKFAQLPQANKLEKLGQSSIQLLSTQSGLFSIDIFSGNLWFVPRLKDGTLDFSDQRLITSEYPTLAKVAVHNDNLYLLVAEERNFEGALISPAYVVLLSGAAAGKKPTFGSVVYYGFSQGFGPDAILAFSQDGKRLYVGTRDYYGSAGGDAIVVLDVLPNGQLGNFRDFFRSPRNYISAIVVR